MTQSINPPSNSQAASPVVMTTKKTKRKRRKPAKQKKPYPGFPLTANTHTTLPDTRT
jgi:hypothetical protein